MPPTMAAPSQMISETPTWAPGWMPALRLRQNQVMISARSQMRARKNWLR